MKIVITGASGILGTACRTVFSELGHEVAPLPHKVLQTFCSQTAENYISGADLLIHAAANTNVEQCEIDVDNCYRDNYLLTEFIAGICSKLNIRMLYVSSTGVYGDYQQEPYREYSKVCPTTHHHRAKLLGENSVRLASHLNLVVRTGWLFGGSFDNRKNFVARRIEEAELAAKTDQIIYSNSEQKGCPTNNIDLARKILELISVDSHGIYNLVNQGHASRLEYVQAICEIAGISIEVRPANSAHFSRLARVSKNETALNWRSTLLGITEMPPWRKSLESYIKASHN